MKSKQQHPLVSVLCITYNHEQFIRKALDGFVMQKTDFAFEVLIHDDASTDNTAQIIHEYAAQYPDIIKPIYQTVNQYSKGVSITKTYNMPRIQGKYTAICEGDDYWTDPLKLQKQVDFLQSHPDFSVCFHPVQVEYADGSRQPEIFPSPEHRFNKTVLELDDLLIHNFIQTNSVMYRWRKDTADVFPENILPGDFYLHLLHAQKGKIGFIDEVMAVYVRHPGGVWWDETHDNDNHHLANGIKEVNCYYNIYINITDSSELYYKSTFLPVFKFIYFFYYSNNRFFELDTLKNIYFKEVMDATLFAKALKLDDVDINAKVQIFTARNDEAFCEQNSVIIQNDGNNVFTHNFIAGYRRIRIDFGNNPSVLSLLQITVYDKSGNILWDFVADSAKMSKIANLQFANTRDGILAFCLTTDPHIILPLFEAEKAPASILIRSVKAEPLSIWLLVAEKDSVIAEKDSVIAEKDSVIAERDSVIAEKDSVIAEKDSAIAERDSVIAEKDSVIAEKDSAIAEKDSVIAETTAQLISTQNAYSAVVNSKIWRMTKSMRVLFDYIKKTLKSNSFTFAIYKVSASLKNNGVGETLQRIKRKTRLKMLKYTVKKWKEEDFIIDGIKYFDIDFYYKTYSDVKRAGADALEHYIHYGWREGRNPSAEFNTGYYIKMYTDIAQADICPLIHYSAFGKKEKRQIKQIYLPMPISEYQLAVDMQIDIVVPIYNGYEYLRDLFDDIFEKTDLPYNLFVINDASTDVRISTLLQTYQKKFGSKLFLYQNEKNLGFIKTVNFALEKTKKNVVLLNTDIRLPKNWASRLFYYIFSNNKVASVTPFSNAATLFSVPEIFIDNVLPPNIPFEQIDDKIKKINPKILSPLEFPTGVGFCMAMSQKALRKIGFFDIIFGKGYGEENDWCMRAIQKGYINVLCPNLFVYHKHGGSFDSEEKKLLCEKNLQIINTRHPSYHQKVINSSQSQEYVHIRKFVQIFFYNLQAEKTVLYFDHSLGGGANIYLKNRVRKIKDTIFCLRIQFLYEEKLFCLSYDYKTYAEELYFVNSTDLFYFINLLHLDEIIINNLVSFPAYKNILDFISEQKKNKPSLFVRMLGHDYFSICPSFNLLNYEGEYCSICWKDVQSKCKICNSLYRQNRDFIDTYIGINVDTDVIQWKKDWGIFFSETINILEVFSQSSKEIFISSYPFLANKIVLNEHPIPNMRKVKIRDHLGINIAFLGGLNFPKGKSIFCSMARLASKGINFFVIGIADEATLNNIFITGKYEIADLPEIMENYKIDIVIIPSICPETFSYTTSEAIMMGLPVASFNLGAPPERISKYKKGLIISQIEAETALNEIIGFVTELRKAEE